MSAIRIWNDLILVIQTFNCLISYSRSGQTFRVEDNMWSWNVLQVFGRTLDLTLLLAVHELT